VRMRPGSQMFRLGDRVVASAYCAHRPEAFSVAFRWCWYVIFRAASAVVPLGRAGDNAAPYWTIAGPLWSFDVTPKGAPRGAGWRAVPFRTVQSPNTRECALRVTVLSVVIHCARTASGFPRRSRHQHRCCRPHATERTAVVLAPTMPESMPTIRWTSQ